MMKEVKSMQTKRHKCTMEKREADVTDSGKNLLVEGYAAVFEQVITLFEIDGVEYHEVIDRDAFAGCDMSDVVFKYNHSSDCLTLARTKNGTLSLTVDERGLKISAQLADVAAGRDLYKLIKRGDIDKMSFAFKVDKDQYDETTHTRRILRFKKIFDVSAVDFPAYDDTTISARDLFGAHAQLADEAEQRKRLTLLSMC